MSDKPVSAEQFAKQWLLDNAPEPLRCVKCNKPQLTGPINSGAIWMDTCKAGPHDGYNGHVYEITIGGEDLSYKRYAQCAEAYAESLRAENARLTGKLKLIKNEAGTVLSYANRPIIRAGPIAWGKTLLRIKQIAAEALEGHNV